MMDGLPSPQSCAALLLLGALQLGLAYKLYAYAIRHVRALEASLIGTLEPVLNPIWVFIAMGERPGPWALAGGIIVLASVTIRAVLSAKTTRQKI